MTRKWWSAPFSRKRRNRGDVGDVSGIMPAGRSRAFTLIELLVVVSIIALLIALLLPAMTQAREAARVAVCGTQLHATHQVLHLYAHDYEGFFPRAKTFASIGVIKFTSGQHDKRVSGGDLRPMINPYIQGDARIFYCPSGGRLLKGEAPYNTGQLINITTADSPYGWNDPRGVRYGFISYSLFPCDDYFGPLLMTNHPLGQWDGFQKDVPRLESSTNPSEEVAAQDQAFSDVGNNRPGFLNHPMSYGEYDNNPLAEEGSGFKTAYQDGHVTWTDADSAEVIGVWSTMRWFR